jgi:hypothetical protein
MTEIIIAIKEVVLKLIEVLFNDKLLVICAVTSIALYALYLQLDNADTIVAPVISGLFGIAVGVSIGARKRSTDNTPVKSIE